MTYTRLLVGIKTAGDIFIQEINALLQDLPGVDIVADGMVTILRNIISDW